MTTQILPTKLFAPTARSNLVPRPGLLERLEEGTGGKLTLISAPAGYGKSTLLSEWVQQTEIPVAWLSLDANDNDVVRFWTYIVAALQTIQELAESRVGENLLESSRASPVPEGESLLGGLIAEITAIPQRFALILDDFHSITETQIQDGLFFLLENLPSGSSGMHLILSSRSDPPWPLARLRVHGELSELRSRDLRFTQTEASSFLNEVMGLALSPGDVCALESRTEGWIAGLQMAAISMRDREDKSGFIQAFTGSHRYVIDYLMEEVLERQSPEIIDFLLKTSILERLNCDLCEAMISGKPTGNQSRGASNYQAILEALEQNNLFVISLDDQRNWYRYHHLFADLLQNRLRARFPDLVPELNRRASQWYTQAGFPLEAVKHALQTEDWDFAAVQIEAHILTLIQHGEITLASQWMSSLPDEIIRPRPILCIAQAWTSAKYATVEFVEELLTQAEAALAAKPEGDGGQKVKIHQLVSNQIAVLQVVIARARGDSTQRQQELALQALDRVLPTGDSSARASLLLRLGFCYLDLGKDEQADRTFSQAFDLGQSSGNHYAAHSAAYGRMVIARRHGRLHELAAICRQTLDTSGKTDNQLRPLMGIPLIMSGSLYYEWNDLIEAESRLTQGLNLVEKVGIAELLVKGHFVLACVELAQGNDGPLPDLVHMAGEGSPRLAVYATYLQARLKSLQSNQSADAQYEGETILQSSAQSLILGGLPSYDWEIGEKLILARMLCKQHRDRPEASSRHRLEEMLDFFADQHQPLEELDWKGILVELYAVIAVMLQTLKRKAKALAALKKALLLAESQGFMRTFVDEGEPMRELIQQARTEGICKTYTQKLLSAFSEPTSVKPQRHSLDQIETFSERELQVLRLLNTQLSVPEIAREIHLAPTTVRTHVQHIYQKLCAHRRIEALQKAEELGLL